MTAKSKDSAPEKQAHTPAPWKAYKATFGWSDGSGEHGRLAQELAEADARLIAAAPQLLEALEDSLRQFAGTPYAETEGYEKARQVVAAAKGEA